MAGRLKCGVRRWGFIQREQAISEGVPGGLGAVDDADFLVDVGHVPASGAFGDDQFLGDLAVAFTLGQELEHFHLSLGQTVGKGWGVVRLRFEPFPAGFNPLGQGPHSQVLCYGHGLFEKRCSLSPVSRTITPGQRVGVIIANPGQLRPVAGPAGEGKAILEMGLCLI